MSTQLSQGLWKTDWLTTDNIMHIRNSCHSNIYIDQQIILIVMNIISLKWLSMSPYDTPTALDGNNVDHVDNVALLGSLFSTISSGVLRFISHAATAFCRLKTFVWNKRDLSKNLRIRLYQLQCRNSTCGYVCMIQRTWHFTMMMPDACYLSKCDVYTLYR